MLDEVTRTQNRIRPKHSDRKLTARGGRNGAVDGAGTDSGRHVLLALRLGNYTGEDAAKSLSDQAHILQLLATYEPGQVELQYRLWTERSSAGDLVPFFDVYLICASESESIQTELMASIGQLMMISFRQGWSVSSLELVEPPAQDHVYELPQSGNVVPKIQDDWSSVVDYLRVLPEPSSLVIFVTPVDGLVQSNVPTPHLDVEYSSAEEKVANSIYLKSAMAELDAVRALDLSTSVTSNAEIQTSVLRVVAGKLYGLTPPNSQIDGTLRLGLAPSQVLRIAHPPYGHIEGRGLAQRRRFTRSLRQVPIATSGVSLGTAVSESATGDQDVHPRLSDESRLQHLYIVGRTGSGKSNLLKHLARQDIEEGRGLAVIDPHGDLVEYLLGHAGKRKDEVLLLDFGDPECIPVINPLDLDVHDASEQALAIEDFIRLITRQSFHEFYGPRFEALVRLTLRSMASSGYPIEERTVVELSRILQTKERRLWIKNSLTDQDLISEWQNFDRQGDQEVAQVLNWALSKFSEMNGDHLLGQVLGGGRSTVSIDDVVSESGILLVTIPEWEMSRSASTLLGSYIQECLRKAVFRRARLNRGKQLKPFYLYVDEFQNFATTDFDEMVAEARKFGLGLTLANQNLRQLEEFSRYSGTSSRRLLEAVVGNVLNMAVFGSSPEDNRYFADYLGLKAESLTRLPRYTPVVSALVSGEQSLFTVKVPNASSNEGYSETRREIRERHRLLGRVKNRSDLSAGIVERESLIESSVVRAREQQRRARNEQRKPAATDRSATPSFLDEWLEKRKKLNQETGAVSQNQKSAPRNSDGVRLTKHSEIQPGSASTKGQESEKHSAESGDNE
ncbi:type IV secretory system conjugative DNA transfer family protein [Rhodococcus sp. BS-15]|uniref:type IV secretory system conjugative DNA transfer family protein n=1 Tax=Rhodococcus sp. BS-15 TaxID=1304954 RepID=UPI00165183AF|nr:type IV secretion system DNA-binding domain-containing protein [Rhodococcus sp. BS-15]